MQLTLVLGKIKTKQAFYAIVFALFIPLIVLSGELRASQATQAPHVINHSPIWQDLIAAKRQDKGVFNRALREAVRDALPLIKLSRIEAVDEAFLNTKLAPRLQVLDASLQKYIRVSASLKSYQQLKRLMPALFAIEEIKLIQTLYKDASVKLPNTRNKRLVRLLDDRISQLADKMIFNMKALVRERRPYEPKLLKAMQTYGVKYSAKPPDFILEYELDLEEESSGKWSYKTQIALLNKLQMPIVKVNEVVITEASTQEQAQQNVLEVMSKLITIQLKMHLVEHG